jgi:hypothetical protein
MMAFIPFGRRYDVAAGDPGIVEHARQPVEQLFPAAEDLASLGFGDALLDAVGRQGSGEREKGNLVHASPSFRPVNEGEIG